MNKETKIQAKKHFGQNFLIDQNLIKKIIDAFTLKTNDTVLEIGPGLGALTEHLVSRLSNSDNNRINVVEIDPELITKLEDKFNHKINLIHSDILKFDINTVTPTDKQSNKLRIIGNLPYNISTPILFHLFKNIQNIQDMLFMLQLEVVDRITAKPNTKQYGRLSVMTQLLCDATKVLHIPATAFKPQPKVESAIVYLKPNLSRWQHVLGDKTTNIDFELFNKIVTAAFNQRRKTISNSLKEYVDEQAFESLNLSPKLRAENLSIEDYLSIYLLHQS